MAESHEAARVVVLPVDDTDRDRAQAIERELVRALRDRRREDVVTPAHVRRVLDAEATRAAAGDAPQKLAPLAADHALYSRVTSEGGKPALRLKLVLVQTGAVLSDAAVVIAGAGNATSASARSVRGAVAQLADDLAQQIEEGAGTEVRATRVAVAPFTSSSPAASDGRVDRFLQDELIAGLRERGFLVVERDQLAEAMNQMALGAALGEAEAPEIGKLLDAQAWVLGGLGEQGDSFVATARVVSTTTGKVLGTSAARIPRTGVVSLAAVETRTAGEAGMRALVVPGWGQAYNLEPGKAALFAIGGYGALATTVGLGIASGVSYQLYASEGTGASAPVTAATSERVVALREQTNALLTSTAIAGGVTAVVWTAGIVDALLVGSAHE